MHITFFGARKKRRAHGSPCQAPSLGHCHIPVATTMLLLGLHPSTCSTTTPSVAALGLAPAADWRSLPRCRPRVLRAHFHLGFAPMQVYRRVSLCSREASRVTANQQSRDNKTHFLGTVLSVLHNSKYGDSSQKINNKTIKTVSLPSCAWEAGRVSSGRRRGRRLPRGRREKRQCRGCRESPGRAGGSGDGRSGGCGTPVTGTRGQARRGGS